MATKKKMLQAAAGNTGIPARTKMSVVSIEIAADRPGNGTGVAVSDSGFIYKASSSTQSPYTNQSTYISQLDQDLVETWSTGFRNPTSTSAINIPAYLKTDSDDNVYSLGYDSYTSAGRNGLCLTKANSSGSIQWVRFIEDSHSLRKMIPGGLAVASNGDVYIAGVKDNGDGVYVGKFNSSGTRLAETLVRVGSFNISSYALVLDDTESNIYIVGHNDTGTFDLPSVVKIDTGLNTIAWSIRYTISVLSGSYSFYDAKLDASGNLVVVGSGQQSANPGRFVPFVMTMTPLGTVFRAYYYTLTTSTLNSYPNMSATTVDIDSTGDIVLGGVYAGVFTAPYTTGEATSNLNMFLIKTSPLGVIRWSKRLGFNKLDGTEGNTNYSAQTTRQSVPRLSLDSSDNIYFSFESSVFCDYLVALPSDGPQIGESVGDIVTSELPLNRFNASVSDTSFSSTDTGINQTSSSTYTQVTPDTTVAEMTALNGSVSIIGSSVFADIRNTTGNVVIGLPSYLQENDVVLVAMATAANGVDVVSAVTSGYSTIAASSGNDNFDVHLYAAWKRMGATPDTTLEIGSIASTANSAGIFVLYLRGVNTTTAIDNKTSTQVTNTALISAPDLTLTTSGALIFSFIASANDNSGAYYKDIVRSWDGFSSFGVNDSSDVSFFCGVKKWVSGTFSPQPPIRTSPDSAVYSAGAITVSFNPA